MNKISLSKAWNVLFSTEGRVFSVTFRKRTTGAFRKMNARLGVTKGVNGVGLSYHPMDKHLLPVYDLQKKAWRSIDLDTIIKIKADGETYSIVKER